MEFVPICLECANFKEIDYCPYFDTIPDAIKMRTQRCKWYSEGEYELFLKGGNKTVNGD